MLSPAIPPQSASGGQPWPSTSTTTSRSNSPWTYLGSKRFEAIAKKHNADVTIWPVDFGSVFAVSGGLPLPKRAPQRQAYRMMELKRWRDHLGVKLTLEPKFFPANEVPAAKCVIALREQGRMADAIKLAHAVLDGAVGRGEEHRRSGDPEGDHRRLRPRRRRRDQGERGAGAWPTSARPTPSTRSTSGVFGAPFFVIDGEIFWGQDRLDFVDRKLACAEARRSSSTSGFGPIRRRAVPPPDGEAVVDDVRHQRRPAANRCAAAASRTSRPSGSTRMTCAGSTWAAAKASELTIQPAIGAPAAGHPAIEQAAEDQLLDQRRQHRHQRAGWPRTARGRARPRSPASCPRGSMPSWLTATDSDQRAQRAEHDRPPAGRPQPERRQARPAHRRHGHDHREQARCTKKSASSASMLPVAATARPPAPAASGRTATKDQRSTTRGWAR